MRMTICEESINFYQKRLIFRKDQINNFLAQREKNFEEYRLLIHNLRIQIVLTRGLVEIPLSGDTRDFDDAILIPKTEIYRVNKLIKVSY